MSFTIIDDLLSETSTYDFKPEIIEHLQKKFRNFPQIIIGEGIHDTDRQLEKMQKLRSSLILEKNTRGDISQEVQKELDEFLKTIVLGWATGSRVSAELVETASSGMPAQPAMYAEPINPRLRRLRTAFYRHFVRRLGV